MLVRVRIKRYAVLMIAATLSACTGGSSSPAISAPPEPTPTRPALALTPDTLLHVHFARPTDWTGRKIQSGAGSGNVTYVAPGRRGTLYVEQNDCAACVDAGLVEHGHRNGSPDPGNALSTYFPTSQHKVDANTVTFTVAATKPYVGQGKLTVTRSHGDLTGYVVVIVTLPNTQAADAAHILASVRVT
jgi:hypothetical protein